MTPSNRIILVLDIETTGLNPEQDCIVEIGIAGIDVRSQQIRPIFSQVVHEPPFGPQHLGSWIFQNSTLVYDEVVRAHSFDRYAKNLQILFQNYYATAYNKAFDFGFFRARGIQIAYELPCPMLICLPIMQLPSRSPEMEYKFPSFEEAWQYFFPTEPYHENHRALDDAMHEAQLVLHLYNQGKFLIAP